MSTLRINNIEAQAVPASPSIDEKIKLTNSSGDVLVHVDGKTSGITTIGINTTAGNIKFDQNSNVVVTGIITATKFVGTIEPTNLTVSGDLTIPDKIIHSGDTNTTIRFPAADTITAETGGSERLRITSDGKFGFGTASLSENSIAEFTRDVGGGALGASITIRNSSTNSVNNIAELRLKTAHGVARIFKYNTGETVFQSHSGGASDLQLQASGAKNFKVTTNSVERFRIDSSGNVMMGVTSSSNRFHVEGTTTGSRFGVDDSASGITALAITNEVNADLETVIYTNKVSLGSSVNIPICFHTNGKANEKLRIDTGGNLFLRSGSANYLVMGSSGDATSGGVTNNMNWIRGNGNNTQLNCAGGFMAFEISGSEIGRFSNDDFLVGTTSNASSNGVGLKLNYHATNPTFNCVINQSNGQHSFYHLYNTNGTNNGYRFYVRADGGVASHEANKVNLSDERMKKNITNMGSVYDTFKQFVFKDYNYITDDESDIKKHGVIAQEVESIDPDLITEDFKTSVDSEGNDVYRKGLKEQQFTMVGLKALQEAMTKIETLEAKVAALEGS